MVWMKHYSRNFIRMKNLDYSYKKSLITSYSPILLIPSSKFMPRYSDTVDVLWADCFAGVSNSSCLKHVYIISATHVYKSYVYDNCIWAAAWFQPHLERARSKKIVWQITLGWLWSAKHSIWSTNWLKTNVPIFLDGIEPGWSPLGQTSNFYTQFVTHHQPVILFMQKSSGLLIRM